MEEEESKVFTNSNEITTSYEEDCIMACTCNSCGRRVTRQEKYTYDCVHCANDPFLVIAQKMNKKLFEKVS